MKCTLCWSAASAALIAAAGLALAGFAPSPTPTPVSSAAPAAAPAQYAIDSVHSAVVFKIDHLGVSNFYGVFQKMSGSFSWDKAAPESLSINATIDAASINTGNSQREAHLKGPDFFNAKEHPEITFKSTAAKKTGDKTLDVTGDLTMLGKTKPVTLKVTIVGEKDAGAQMGGYQAGFDATATIKRSDFGMTYGVSMGALGDEVTLTIGFAGAKK